MGESPIYVLKGIEDMRMQSMMAGYFGGYSAKMQDIGTKELQRLREALERKVDRTAHRPFLFPGL